jgi:signal transduction histidine kinase/putative methionine-R-sulfoxide reductase with GAF domain
MTQGLAGWVAKNRQAGLIYDTETDERWVSQPNRRTVDTRSALSVPILNQKELLGILTLTHSTPHHFNEEHLRLLQAAADQMSLALRNAQIFDALRHTADLQITLYEVMRIVTEQNDPDEVQRLAVEAIAQCAGWRNVALILNYPADGIWQVSAGVGVMEQVIGQSRSVDQGIIGQAIRTGQPQIVNDVQASPNYLPAHPDIRSELAVPMKRGHRILGVLDIESLKVNAFDNDDVMLVNLLADAVGLALDNAYLYTETQRQLNQQIMQSSRLHALIEASRDGIMFIGHSRRIFVVNQPALRLLNWPGSPEDWMDCDVLEVILETRRHSTEAAKMMSAEVRRLAKGDFSVNEGHLSVANRHISWLNLPVTANQNEIGRLIVLHDATEQHLLENMREDLTHTMVHDLRNPVSAIYTSLHLIEEMLSPISLEQKTTIHVAHKNIQKMLNLIDHILDVSRLEGRRMPLSLHPLDLVRLTREAVETQMPLAQTRHLKLILKADQNLPPVLADQNLVSRVLQNLIGNAIKFTPLDGTVAVKVSRYQSHQQLVVSVSDTGPGIDSDMQTSIFQKFVTGRRPESGSGLGLTFCKLVIDAHEGQIWVESQPGQHTTFFFTLPLAQPESTPSLAHPIPE